jgi:phenylacetate-CoA ligase
MGSFYRISNFIIDKLSGFDISSELKKVLEMDHWTRDQIMLDQRVKFDKLSSFAGNSKYYRNYKGKELGDYPVMYREDYKRNFENLKTHIRKPYCTRYSSGSTSNPVVLLISREMLLAKRVSHQKMLQWYGLARESSEFKLGGIKCDLITNLYYLLRNKRFIDSFGIKDKNHEEIINDYNRFRPKILYGYPSAIHNLIQFAKETDKRLHSPEIIVTHAETLYKEYEEKFKHNFPGSKIVNQYWATEANIAVTCTAGNLHVDEDTVICETINMDENGIGDLLVTNLYSYDLPIIRYAIGDRVKLSDEECPCGRKSKLIENIEGRDIDYLELPDNKRIPITAFYFSRFSKNIDAYQLVYYKSQKLLEFRYKGKEEVKIESAKIADYIRKDFGLSTRFVRMEKLKYTQGGKFRKLWVEN